MVIPKGEIMRSSSVVVIAFLLTLIATLAFAKPDSDQHYRAELHSDDKGGEVVVRLEVTPTAGWKWNNKFPYSFRVETESGKPTRVLGQQFKREGRTFTVSFRLVQPSQSITVIIVGKFSVCSSGTCDVLRDQRFRYKILSTELLKR